MTTRAHALLASVLAAVAIALSPDRRRTVRRLGWGVLAGGLILAALVPLAQVIAGSRIADGPLSRAVSAGLRMRSAP